MWKSLVNIMTDNEHEATSGTQCEVGLRLRQKASRKTFQALIYRNAGRICRGSVSGQLNRRRVTSPVILYLVLLRELEVVVGIQTLHVFLQLRHGHRRVARHACSGRRERESGRETDRETREGEREGERPFRVVYKTPCGKDWSQTKRSSGAL